MFKSTHPATQPTKQQQQQQRQQAFWQELEETFWLQCAGHYCNKLKWYLTIDAFHQMYDFTEMYVCDTL